MGPSFDKFFEKVSFSFFVHQFLNTLLDHQFSIYNEDDSITCCTKGPI